MIPLLLALALFAFWVLLGRGVISIIRPKHPVLQAWLLAPCVGLSVNVLLITWLNQWGPEGIPVKEVAWPIAIFLSVLTVAALFWKKPIIPVRQLRPFLGIALLSLFYTGWPLILFGFNWISYGNDDMANYCLAAVRLLNNGFYRLPLVEELGGLDYSQYFWFMHVPGLIRFGSEMLLSWVARITGLNPLHAFMPVIVALSMVQVFSTMALVLSLGRARKLALSAGFLLTVSPVFLLGTYVQLIAQVGGVALMLACLTLAADVLRQQRWAPSWGTMFLLALVSAALCIYYPEVTPFAGLAFILYTSFTLLKKKRFSWSTVTLLAAVPILLILLNRNVASYINTLLVQTATGSQGGATDDHFPPYLVPSGLPTLLGWLNLGNPLPDPWVSLLITAALCFLPFVLATGLFQAAKGSLWASLFAVMVLMGGYLFFICQSGFGLFKLAMFCQPVLAVAIACLFTFIKPQRFWPVAVYSLLLLWVGLKYGVDSLGLNMSGSNFLPGASQVGIRLDASKIVHRTVSSDFSNVVAVKLSNLFLRGIRTEYPARMPFTSFLDYAEVKETFRIAQPSEDWQQKAKDLVQHVRADWVKRDSILGSDYVYYANPSSDPAQPSETPLWILQPQNLLPLNGISLRQSKRKASSFLEITPQNEIQNRLSFVHSSKGQHYYGGVKGTISFSQGEEDPYKTTSFCYGIGSYFLFQVINPAKPIWVRMSISRTLQGKGRTELPQTGMLGAQENMPLPFLGNGAANLYVGPFSPFRRGDSDLFAVDLNLPPEYFPNKRSGMMKLFGKDIILDSRKIIGLARDFSVVSDAEYHGLSRPKTLDRFPEQLVSDEGLEYSGFYEDGWVSPRAFCVLGESSSQDVINIRGHLPGISSFLASGNILKVRTSSQKEYVYKLNPGDFSIAVPCDAKNSETRIDLSFQKHVDLPFPDDRPAGMRLISLGIVPASEMPPTPTLLYTRPLRLSDFSRQLSGENTVEQDGIYPDGWMAKQSFCTMGSSRTGGFLQVRGMVPAKNHLVVKINGEEKTAVALSPGDFDLKIPCTKTAPLTRIEFEFQDETKLPSPDTRSAAALLSSVEIIHP